MRRLPPESTRLRRSNREEREGGRPTHAHPLVDREAYLAVCGELGLSALVEAHSEAEADAAVKAGARIIGVNNRNLKDFSVSLDTSCRLRPLVPKDTLFVAESGIRCRADIDRLREAGADAVLIGETLMRSADKKAALAELTGERHG